MKKILILLIVATGLMAEDKPRELTPQEQIEVLKNKVLALQGEIVDYQNVLAYYQSKPNPGQAALNASAAAIKAKYGCTIMANLDCVPDKKK